MRKLVKRAQVRKGPKGSYQIKPKRGVVYLRPEFIGTQVIVMTIGTYKGIRRELKNNISKLAKIRQLFHQKNCVDKNK